MCPGGCSTGGGRLRMRRFEGERILLSSLRPLLMWGVGGMLSGYPREGQEVRRFPDVRVESWDQFACDPLGERGPLRPRLSGVRHLRMEVVSLLHSHLSDPFHDQAESTRRGHT